jgi:5-methylcytosine-specific restriction endonuclease McrA
MQKRCPRCERELPLDAFYRDASKASGYQSRCKECECAVLRDRYHVKHPEAKRQGERSMIPCAICGQAFHKNYEARRYCSRRCCAIANAWEGWLRRSAAVSAKQRYEARRRYAGGLTRGEQARLLAVWRRRGRRCAYCGGTPDTVDHVVPLYRGGTNREGNLARACRTCNSRKGARLLAEWRYVA